MTISYTVHGSASVQLTVFRLFSNNTKPRPLQFHVHYAWFM